MALMVPIFE
ncbi:Protein of unknown function [Pyronema omphalodes CBS 100304]|uniref:Uncharacterized protein n=1 Tax=Pyronema omphalodes (strain CBS 100304) TaxID=1076935 RepID=U4KW54_PYROM|nr:Protein of unknown function [Pyronema omphalodes CBS 100304]